MQAARKQHSNGINISDAIITSSFNNNNNEKFKFVIHACAPWKTQEQDDDNVKKLLRTTYKNVFDIAMKTKNIESIAIPALGCGVNLIDPTISALEALNAMKDITENNENNIDDGRKETFLNVEFWLLDYLAYNQFNEIVSPNVCKIE